MQYNKILQSVPLFVFFILFLLRGEQSNDIIKKMLPQESYMPLLF